MDQQDDDEELPELTPEDHPIRFSTAAERWIARLDADPALFEELQRRGYTRAKHDAIVEMVGRFELEETPLTDAGGSLEFVLFQAVFPWLDVADDIVDARRPRAVPTPRRNEVRRKRKVVRKTKKRRHKTR